MTFCFICGITGTVDEIRKHHFSKHYEYYKSQLVDEGGACKMTQTFDE